MNWLITGGCGFIGSQLVNELLLCEDYNIRIIDNFSSTSIISLPFNLSKDDVIDCNFDVDWKKKLEIVCLDVLNLEELNPLFALADVVIHLAANTGVQVSIDRPLDDCHNNVLGTLNVLEACRINQVKKMVFASSGAPLGGQNPPLHENLPTKPLSPYGASKAAGEAYCNAYFHSFSDYVM